MYVYVCADFRLFFLINCDLGQQYCIMVAFGNFDIVGPLSAQICMFHIPFHFPVLIFGSLNLVVDFERSCMVYFYRSITEARSKNLPYGLPNLMCSSLAISLSLCNGNFSHWVNKFNCLSCSDNFFLSFIISFGVHTSISHFLLKGWSRLGGFFLLNEASTLLLCCCFLFLFFLTARFLFTFCCVCECVFFWWSTGDGVVIRGILAALLISNVDCFRREAFFLCQLLCCHHLYCVQKWVMLWMCIWILHRPLEQ